MSSGKKTFPLWQWNSQKFHLRDIFSPINFTIPANLGLIYLGYFQKKRTFIPMLFLESSLADQQGLCNKDTQPQSSIGWSGIFCGIVNHLSCTLWGQSSSITWAVRSGCSFHSRLLFLKGPLGRTDFVWKLMPGAL